MREGEPTVDEQIDALFALPAEEFTAARDRLAASLRKAGDRATATEVKQLRRPTLVAWTLNQLARRHRDEVADLVAVGEQLREALEQAVSGLGAGPLRQAQQQRRSAVTELVDLAGEVLREQGSTPDSHLPAIRRVLEAASTDEVAARKLLEARLSQPPEPVSGFGGLDVLGAATHKKSTTKTPGTADHRVDDDTAPDTDLIPGEETRAEERRAQAERAAVRLQDAERAAEAAATEAERLRSEADRAAQAARDAAADAEQLARELEAAREAARASETRAAEADREARAAEAAAQQREQELADARQQADRLGRG